MARIFGGLSGSLGGRARLGVSRRGNVWAGARGRALGGLAYGGLMVGPCGRRHAGSCRPVGACTRPGWPVVLVLAAALAVGGIVAWWGWTL